MKKNYFSSNHIFKTEVGCSLVNARNGNEFCECEQSNILAYNTKILHLAAFIKQNLLILISEIQGLLIYMWEYSTHMRKKINLLPNWHKLNPNKTSKLHILATKSPPDI